MYLLHRQHIPDPRHPASCRAREAQAMVAQKKLQSRAQSRQPSHHGILTMAAPMYQVQCLKSQYQIASGILPGLIRDLNIQNMKSTLNPLQ